MDLRKRKSSRKSWILPLVLSTFCLIFSIIIDFIWGDQLMALSVHYSEFLIQLVWLRFLMYFFSYGVFFSIFTCKSIHTTIPLSFRILIRSLIDQVLHRVESCRELEEYRLLYVRNISAGNPQVSIFGLAPRLPISQFRF